MTPEDYNEESIERYGWSPEDLDLADDASDSDIVDAVMAFQHAQGLTPDGKVGPITWGRLQTYVEYRKAAEGDGSWSILSNGKYVSVDFPCIPAAVGSEFSLIGEGGYSKRRGEPHQVVWHWDAALSAKSTHKILLKRNLAYHGVIDNDGTFVQFLDLGEHAAWHAGRGFNGSSIGISVSNAVYTKYQDYYEKRWGQRPIISATVHGKKHTLLGYYPEQIETATKLAAFIHGEYGIPLVSPDTDTVFDGASDYEGHIAHYNCTKRKWDVAGFPFTKIMEEASNEQA